MFESAKQHVGSAGDDLPCALCCSPCPDMYPQPVKNTTLDTCPLGWGLWLCSVADYPLQYNTIQYSLLEAVRTQRRTIIEREKYVENENVKMVHNE